MIASIKGSFTPSVSVNVELTLSLKSMKTNRVAPEWDCNPFWSDSILFNESYVTNVIAALTLTLGVNGPNLDF